MKEHITSILIAPDKFKGSLSSTEICSIIKNEIASAIPEAIIDICPLADGGEGTIDVLSTYISLIEHTCETIDPLGRPISASYFASDDTAYIELSRASGHSLLDLSERNPMYTSTFGTGLLIKDAFDKGLKRISLFLGGSSTNDGGIGIAHALGYQFLDREGNRLPPIGKSLKDIHEIKLAELDFNWDKITIYSDVNNPPFGPNGAAFVFGKQKGASPNEIIDLDEGIKNLCEQIKRYTSKSIAFLQGGGAAGGAALCLYAFMNAEIMSGMDFMSSITRLESRIEAADIVISGEGTLDIQSKKGKVVSGVSTISQKMGTQLWLIVGKNELTPAALKASGIHKVYSIIEMATDLDDAMKNSRIYLSKIGKSIANDIGIMA